MLPILVALGGLALYHHHHAKAHAAPAASAVPAAVVKAHGALMAGEFNPGALERHAARFRGAGFGAQAAELDAKAREVRAQAKACAELVDRARANDENAIAMIAGVRENAEKGDPRAQISCIVIRKYCEENPPPALGPHGELPL